MERAVIADLNPDLTKAYQTIKNQPEKLINQLSEIKDTYFKLKDEDARKEFFLEKRIDFNKRTSKALRNTALLIFLNQTCFNGLYRVNSKGGFNVPFGRYTNPRICNSKTILSVSQALQKVEILNVDFEKTLKYADKQSFFYFDPPYKPISKTASFNAYAADNFDDNEQKRLKNFCDKVDKKGHFFILSNSDVKNHDTSNNFFDELYADYKIRRVKAKRAINSKGDKRGEIYELLIQNR